MVLHPVLDLAQHRVDRRVLALRRHILSIGALAHIALDAQEALQAVFAVIERCDHQTIEKFRSVGPIVENVDRDILLLAQRLADQPRMVRIGVVALKKPTIPPDRSGCGIAGDLLEGAVGVDDRIVGDVWIGQNQCQRQLGEGRRAHALRHREGRLSPVFPLVHSSPQSVCASRKPPSWIGGRSAS